MSRWICIDDICIPSDENDWEELVAFADAIAEQEPIDIVRCEECKYNSICNHGVQHTTRDMSSVTIGYKSVEWCSYGEREGE